MIYDVQLRFPGEAPKDAELLIHESTLRHMVESVTKAPGQRELSRATEEYLRSTDDIPPPPPPQFPKKHQAPPVDDMLAKAREDGEKYYDSEGKETFLNHLVVLEPEWAANVIRSHRATIRERDEKLSQMMTVDELKKWVDAWNGDGNLFNIIRDKIKERNEKARKEGE